MSMSASIHEPTFAEARVNKFSGGVLVIRDKMGSDVAVFMPYEKARAMADAFNAKQPAAFATSA